MKTIEHLAEAIYLQQENVSLPKSATDPTNDEPALVACSGKREATNLQ